MTKRERVAAALKGEAVDRVPVSAWGHYASDPRTGDDLARAAIGFQQTFDWDFAKIMPTGMSPAMALGAKTFYEPVPKGTSRLAEPLFRDPAGWARLPVVDPTNNDIFAAPVKAARRGGGGPPEGAPRG